MRYCKQCREYKKSLESLTRFVSMALRGMDNILKEPESIKRGKKIAALVNALDFANDEALHFGLGITFKSKKWKELHKP